MAHPKRKTSKTRRDKGRTHHKLGSKPMVADPVTGDVGIYHRVNLETGMYKGVKVMKGKNEE
ncbi:MAG: 50S ribosomal protein L32 [Bacteroidetes bacterium]|nr:50S ribosomal protein L32 [Bacteroidota bacterium]